MKYLFTPLYWLFFALTLPVCALTVFLVFLAAAPFDRNRSAAHRVVCAWSSLYLRVSPAWSVRVEGRELLPSRPCVLVANHQSMADIFAANLLFYPFKYVSKASLFRVPFLGWIMHLAGYMSLERGSLHSTRGMMEQCRAWLRSGVSVLLFPEGTYSEGGRLRPFKRGAFQLALEEQVPLVPVVLEGTTDIIAGDGPWVNPRATVRVRVLPSLSPGSFGEDAAALSEQVLAVYRKALGQDRR